MQEEQLFKTLSEAEKIEEEKTIQENLFEIPSETETEWQNMPEYLHSDKTSIRQIIVHFKTQEDINKFEKAMEQNITGKTKSIWYPKLKIDRFMDKVWIDES